MMPWSVKPKQYGEFYIQIFDDWVRKDVGEVFVQFFDVALGNWMGLGSGLCKFSPTCGHAVVLEHNGDLYACDHYVYPQYRLGNNMERQFSELMESDKQRKFGSDKQDLLPQYCKDCKVRFACHGDCPKHRFARSPDAEPGLSYLCLSYKRIFKHIDPYMQVMAQLVKSSRRGSRG